VENKEIAPAVTIFGVLLSGFPGLISLCPIGIFFFAEPFPDQPALVWMMSILLLCGGASFIAISVVAGILSLSGTTLDKPISTQDEPIPP